MNLDFSSMELAQFGKQVNFSPSSQKLIGLYFSAHWCPPARLFTPKLITFYNLINSPNKQLEIISVSFDRDLACWESYFEEMPWLAIPFTNEPLRMSLAKQLNIKNPFKLIILSPDGKIITFNGIEDLKSKGSDAFDYWNTTNSSMARFKSPPFCSSGHLMVFADSKEGKKCHLCSCELITGWACQECDLLLCHSCQEWKCNSVLDESELKCLNLHPLRMGQSLNEFYMKRFLNEIYNCRTCNELQKGEGFHCRPCLFDICTECFKVIKDSKGMNRTKCSQGHDMLWSNNLCMIIQEKFKYCKFRCEDCGESYLGGGAFACIDCEYYQCVKCFALVSTPSL